ncbi:hypothetical protein QNH38_08070 [Paenibacillus polymyxa]|uniref:hypothetical protein n=1 Tax=Paenibacillus polymyxa TaxID=1406 RepID=UPI0024C0D12C|nr:hypothetical protein [Paenibacillus polymyxa]WHX37387.1 hypothetical protein QNH38_08070 [Paenibacillus polymyxa]
MSERTVDLIRKDVQSAKNEAKKNILLPVREVSDLLALVDSLQQQVKELQEGNKAACESREIAVKSMRETCITSNVHYAKVVELVDQLAERNRTIARLSADLDTSVASQLNMTDKAYRYQKAMKEAKTAIQKNLAFANKDEQALLSAFNHINKALGE